MKFFSSTHYTPQQLQNIAIDLFCDILGSILSAIGIYTFAKLASFAPGGISGVALILNHLWNLPIGTTSLVINIPLILLSYRIVGRKFMIKSIRTILINTFFLDFVFPLTPAYDGNPMLAALFSGVFFGCGLALIYMRGSSTGGTDFLTMSIKALHPHLSIGAVTMAIDLVIILIGWPVYGNPDAVLYGLISTFVTSTVIDKIMYGTSAGKLAIIITTQGPAMATHIDEVCARGSTLIRAKGSYTTTERQVLLCACSKAEAYKVRRAAHQTDPDAFVMITETSEVFGEGFYMVEVEVKRLSNSEDRIPLMISERLIDVTQDYTGEYIMVHGQFRSYNRHEEQKNRLVLSVFVREISFMEEEPDGTKTNSIWLDGYICKEPIYRKTPLGREIADLLLAVNRPYGKSDYIPCICWGRNARYASGFEVGEHVQLLGRIQSREYVKRISDTETEKRIAYEVSVSKLEYVE